MDKETSKEAFAWSPRTTIQNFEAFKKKKERILKTKMTFIM